MAISNLEKNIIIYLIVIYVYIVLITTFFIMSVRFMLYRRKKYLKKYFQKYIDIESLYSIRPNNIREIIFYFLLYIAALLLPFLFLESLFLDRSSLESITILW
ncbi:Uncharacterised protein, partial [Mycoplasma putrefaciens]